MDSDSWAEIPPTNDDKRWLVRIASPHLNYLRKPSIMKDAPIREECGSYWSIGSCSPASPSWTLCDATVILVHNDWSIYIKGLSFCRLLGWSKRRTPSICCFDLSIKMYWDENNLWNESTTIKTWRRWNRWYQGCHSHQRKHQLSEEHESRDDNTEVGELLSY